MTSTEEVEEKNSETLVHCKGVETVGCHVSNRCCTLAGKVHLECHSSLPYLKLQHDKLKENILNVYFRNSNEFSKPTILNPLLLFPLFQCWDNCVSPPSNKINTSIQETWPLRVISLIRQGSLVSSDLAWPEAKEPTQCLVTWEVAGGGLMGNLLTDSAGVELSLWPETKYRVQVTCKNKVSPSVARPAIN